MVSAAVFSPDAPDLATAAADGTVRLWNLPGSVLTGPGGAVDSVATGQDGQVLAASDTHGTVWLWDLADPRRHGLALTVRSSSVDSMALSPDGRILAAPGTAKAATEGLVRLWDISDLARPIELPPLILPQASVESLAFSPDGKTLAVGGYQQVRLIDPSNGTVLATLTGVAQLAAHRR